MCPPVYLYLRAGQNSGSPEVVLNPNDIVFGADAELRFDQDERFAGVVFDPVLLFLLDPDDVAGAYLEAFFPERHQPGALNDDPDFGALMMVLEREALSGKNENPLYAI